MLSNREIDAEWFRALHKEGFTCDEIAAKECVWTNAIDIAAEIGISYTPDSSQEAIMFSVM